ncbi:hypothetical protein DFP72DRAFT_1044664 [Ephemerocybe angulata]|uniref:Uncharacterized protein n=1 Tax=Ephemerocybe angulata TaxID=980116 RepID=A0A8H6I3Z8_9AGAR|nr:hypothetical protein DFP72DRAFT_1044664 [Tulosesus angulatus]
MAAFFVLLIMAGIVGIVGELRASDNFAAGRMAGNGEPTREGGGKERTDAVRLEESWKLKEASSVHTKILSILDDSPVRTDLAGRWTLEWEEGVIRKERADMRTNASKYPPLPLQSTERVNAIAAAMTPPRVKDKYHKNGRKTEPMNETSWSGGVLFKR